MNLSKNKLRCIKFTVLFLFTVSFSLNIIYHFYPSVSSIYTRLFIRFFSLFFTGATAYMYREKLYFSFWLVLPAVLILAASTFQKDVFFVVYCITLPYLVFYIAYVPINFLHNFNKFGDYSYGIYIYAFPIQQSVISLLPKITIIGMTILSFCITFILAFLSWHIIEKNALKLKNKI